MSEKIEINFKPNCEKALECIVWIANNAYLIRNIEPSIREKIELEIHNVLKYDRGTWMPNILPNSLKSYNDPNTLYMRSVIYSDIFYIMYNADKEHLNKYGRPIYGEKYIAYSFGPVPMTMMDIIEFNDWFICSTHTSRANSLLNYSISREQLMSFKILKAEGYEEAICANRDVDANFDLFSESDLECLKNSVMSFLLKPTSKKYSARMGEYSSIRKECFYGVREVQIMKKILQEKGIYIDYETMIDDNNPLKEGIIEDLRETGKSIVF